MEWFITGMAIYARIENTLKKRERETRRGGVSNGGMLHQTLWIVNVAFVKYKQSIQG